MSLLGYFGIQVYADPQVDPMGRSLTAASSMATTEFALAYVLVLCGMQTQTIGAEYRLVARAEGGAGSEQFRLQEAAGGILPVTANCGQYML